MRAHFMATIVVAITVLWIIPPAALGQDCTLNCPLGDGGVIGPGNGENKSPDLDGNAVVGLVDLAIFAQVYPPNPPDYCADFDCNGLLDLVDLALFAQHYTHAGPTAGFCTFPWDVAWTHTTGDSALNGEQNPPCDCGDGHAMLNTMFTAYTSTHNGEVIVRVLGHAPRSIRWSAGLAPLSRHQ